MINLHTFFSFGATWNILCPELENIMWLTNLGQITHSNIVLFFHSCMQITKHLINRPISPSLPSLILLLFLHLFQDQQYLLVTQPAIIFYVYTKNPNQNAQKVGFPGVFCFFNIRKGKLFGFCNRKKTTSSGRIHMWHWCRNV